MVTPSPLPPPARVGYRRPINRCLWLLPLPGVLTALALIWTSSHPLPLRLATTGLLLTVTVAVAWRTRDHLAYSLRTLANIVAAMRDGDFSIRPHSVPTRDPLGNLAAEIHALGDMLREQRLGAVEADALLRTALEEMDAAIFTFDDQRRLRLANRAAERLLARPVEQLLGRTTADLGLESCLEGEPARVAAMAFAGAVGRFGIRRTGFRQGGRPHHLLVVADLSRALRDEERLAWQRLLRVLGHELNNSLAPIKSVATSLEVLCRREPRPPDWQDDIREGLALISSRAEALSRFMQAYSQLARLPPPVRAPMSVPDLVHRVAELETRFPIHIRPGPDVTLHADRDQLEQLLINLVRNAADAALERPPAPPDPNTAPPRVTIEWHVAPTAIDIVIADNGPGIANPANLFVPFFTTKPKGSGIGLTLCRQIAEAHEGRLTLENQPDGRGCVARLALPR